MIVYHGSTQVFDHFDATHIGRGEGVHAYGYGHYLTQHPGVARIYANAATPDEQSHIYTVELPNEAINRLLLWDLPLAKQPDIKRLLEKIDDSMFRAWQTNGAWDYVHGENIYRHLAEGLTNRSATNGAHIKASESLRTIGICGVCYIDKANSSATGENIANSLIFPGEEHFLRITHRDGAAVETTDVECESNTLTACI